ncbi:glycerophosphodiester phosphodiesterase [Candidatus Poribacteria bacterium]|nr:glycerophosphodiester phosphodiesterase [Candidatus Poribacteria bacterium]
MTITRKQPAAGYLKIAHRGASAHEPENTLRAFRRALELGADAIELDVHVSKDGELVVIHDAYVDKTTDGTGAVAEMASNELRRLDAGEGEPIPTLAEVIDGFAREAVLCIELKGEGSAIPTADLVRGKRCVDRVILCSFDAAKVRRVKEHAPEIETSVLTGSWEEDFLLLAREAKADCIHFCWERHPQPHTLLTDDVMRRAHEAGLEVVLWHEERPDEIRELIRKPIYGICSNNPELL